MARIVFYIIMLLALPSALAAEEACQTDPLCWGEARTYHPKDEGQIRFALDTTKERLSITHAEDRLSGEIVKSPNNAYAFSYRTIETEVDAGRYRRDMEVLVYSERPYLISHYASKVHGLSSISWVNEKTIYYRLWWGRLVGIDVFYDVEKEEVVALQPVNTGWQTYNQYKAQCESPQWNETEACRPKCPPPMPVE